MKEIVSPAPAPIVRNELQRVQELFRKFVVPSYARFDVAFTRGSGSYLWDVNGKRYLDLGGGIAVCALGHANPEITEALVRQSQQLVHVSNLYYNEPQGRLAQALHLRWRFLPQPKAKAWSSNGVAIHHPRETFQFQPHQSR